MCTNLVSEFTAKVIVIVLAEVEMKSMTIALQTFIKRLKNKRPKLGHYRRSEYNEHFCYKLDFLAKQKPGQPYL